MKKSLQSGRDGKAEKVALPPLEAFTKRILIILALLITATSQFNQTFAADNLYQKPNIQPLTNQKIITDKKETGTTVNISLSDCIKQYRYQYLDTFISTLAALSNSKINITSYNTSKGEIKAKLGNGKGLYILVNAPQSNMTQVRITPADGIYDIPAETISKLFEDIRIELNKYK
ncbi:MAG: hypothetical protein ACD_20C00047G0007 [uncultured bacterium]|nr:MAG: hypothetical protein ACD_20C00047G0007 [uncultured bacterium]